MTPDDISPADVNPGDVYDDPQPVHRLPLMPPREDVPEGPDTDLIIVPQVPEVGPEVVPPMPPMPFPPLPSLDRRKG